MPKFLERELRRQAAKKGLKGKHADHYVYGAMNNAGAMHGSKETAKGREMEKKHERDTMKDHGLRRMEIEVHRDGAGKITGHTVTHTPYEKPKSSKSGAFYQEPKRSEFPFSAKDHESMIDHVAEHLGGDEKSEA